MRSGSLKRINKSNRKYTFIKNEFFLFKNKKKEEMNIKRSMFAIWIIKRKNLRLCMAHSTVTVTASKVMAITEIAVAIAVTETTLNPNNCNGKILKK